MLLLVDRPLGSSELDRVREWVQSGGGLILVAGERGGWGTGGEALFPGALGGIEDRDGRGERIATVEYEHPIFEVFRGPRQGDFSAARFDDGSPALAERRTGDGRVLVWTSTLDASWTDLALQPVFLPFVHELARYASGATDAFESVARRPFSTRSPNS